MSQRPSIATSRIFAAGLLSSATAVMSSRLDKFLFLLLASGSLLLALSVATSLWESAERSIAAAIRARVLEPLRPLAQQALAYGKLAARGVVRLVTTPVATPAAPAASASAGARIITSSRRAHSPDNTIGHARHDDLLQQQDEKSSVAIKPNASRLPPSASKSPIWKVLRQLGPGLITGASDDDPSGIATYSQVGAQFGFGLLWVMPFSYPLMAAIQEICARIGRVTGKGIAANVRGNYPRAVLVGLVLLLLVANTFNLGADIGAMAAAAKLIVAGPAWLYIVFFGGFTLALQIFVPYTRYVVYLKWLTLALFAYIATGFVLGQPKWEAIRATFWPSIKLSGEYFTSLIAVLGTTISPYLFFWQASEEAEDVAIERKSRPLNQAPEQSTKQLRRIRIDTYAGMAISNIVAFFIILATAATLHAHGITGIDTADQAALALKPFAGKFAFLLFALGIVGTGLLAVPVLAASAAYAVSETFGWPASLEKKPRQAVRFYATIAVATLVGLALNFVNINPIKALFWSAVLNGVAAVPLMILIMLAASNRKIMGQFALPLVLRIGGWLATLVMLLASLGMLIGSRG